ncbi:MAG: hypothetical protein JF593_02730 [Novosphingobium sp.]|nr:hypothetical protein [Novosphingobium sp.]
MDETLAKAAPADVLAGSKGFWVVAIASLLWNAYGVLDYSMTKLHNSAWLQAMKVDPAFLAKIDGAPAWATGGWAVGVWASLAGSLLLLLRSRHAALAFLVSLIGAVVSFSWMYGARIMPTLVVPAVIVGAIVLQWWYARRMDGAGVLR